MHVEIVVNLLSTTVRAVPGTAQSVNILVLAVAAPKAPKASGSGYSTGSRSPGTEQRGR